MKTIQIVLDEDLLHTADRVARQREVNRSSLVREALRSYLRQLQVEEKERQDREGYERYPDTGELDVWQEVAVWPDE